MTPATFANAGVANVGVAANDATQAQLVQWFGNGLSPGAFTTSSAGTGDTPPGTVIGSNMTVDATGVRSPRIKWTDGNTGYGVWGHASASVAAWRWYNEFASFGAGFRVALAWTGSAAAWVLDVGSDGTLFLLDNGGGTLDQTASGAFQTNTLHRIEVTYNAGATTVDLFAGESTSPIDTLTASQSSLNITEFWWGATFDTSRGVGYGDDLIMRRGATAIGPVPVSGTSAPAGSAAVTATANDATVKVSPGSQVANVTAAANQPTITVKPGSQVANVAAAANNTTSSVATGAQNAAVTATANQPSPSVKATAEVANVGVAANQPTISTTGGTQAAAGNAAVTAAANNPTIQISTSAQNAAVTAAANNTTSKVSPSAESAPVNAAANQPTVVTGSFTFANAQVAAVTATANGTTSKVSTGAQVAAVAGVANAPNPAVKASATLASVTVAASNATGKILVTAAPAVVITAARDPGGKVLVGAGVAAASVAANNISTVVPAVYTHLSARPVRSRYSAEPADEISAVGAGNRYSVE